MLDFRGHKMKCRIKVFSLLKFLKDNRRDLSSSDCTQLITRPQTSSLLLHSCLVGAPLPDALVVGGQGYYLALNDYINKLEQEPSMKEFLLWFRDAALFSATGVVPNQWVKKHFPALAGDMSRTIVKLWSNWACNIINPFSHKIEDSLL